jgi:TPP-dependent indolepyruvate ferredoxin oxidoreductase alpha subunit
MKGTAALAEALRFFSDAWYSVPGYPVTELARMIGAETVINEKVALEYALGNSISGKRAAVIIKNVGMNACCDPLVNATTQGLKSGLVIIAGDDLNAKGSQNTQDSRYFGELAQTPVIEPDAETCYDAIGAAFDASEQFSRIVIVRVTPPLLEGEVHAGTRLRHKGEGQLAAPDLTMKGRTQASEQKTAEMFAWSRSSSLNRWKGGIVGVGAAHGTSHAVTVYPPPAEADILNQTHELGRPFVHEHRFINPPVVCKAPETFTERGFCRTFCGACPFKPLFGLLKEKELSAICDIGCSVLAANPPYRIGIACYALGSSIAVAAKSTKVALTGDFALLHSGINALIDAYEKGYPLLCIVLKNDRMGMTGGQPVYNLLHYIAWLNPVVCKADDEVTLRKELVITDRLHMLVIDGTCPEGCSHETVEY